MKEREEEFEVGFQEVKRKTENIWKGAKKTSWANSISSAS